MRVEELERKLWICDQKINARGFLVDTALAKKAAIACSAEKLELDQRVSDVTFGIVESGTQVQRIKDFLVSHKFPLPNLKADTLDQALVNPDIPHPVKVVLEARQRVSKSSTAKYNSVLKAVGPDRRLRGGLQFAGAARTARWAGRIFQPHNLPRPSRKWDEVQTCIRALQQGHQDLLTDNVHQLCSDVARSIIVAKKDHTLHVADYSSIEGRVLAWLANEKWKLKAYNVGADMYVETYQRLFGLPSDTEISSYERQQGKCFELSMGYEGGVKALLGSAPTYGVDVNKLGQGAWSVADPNVKKFAKKLHGFAVLRKDPTPGIIGERLYTQLEAAKIMWRNISPETKRLWKLFSDAARAAIDNPGKKFKAGRCIFMRSVNVDILFVKLPSGRYLLYSNPKVHADKKGKISMTYASIYGGREYMYGGKLAENITQAIARDLLAVALLKADRAGFPIILHVHDEIIAECANDSDLTLKRLIAVMAAKPNWAAGLPIAAEGFSGKRYRKD